MTEEEIKEAARKHSHQELPFFDPEKNFHKQLVKNAEISFIAGAEANAPKWIPISEGPPKKPGLKNYERVPCLVVINHGVGLLLWNCEHEWWDDPDGDDYVCDFIGVSYYMPLSQLPEPPKQ